MTEHDNEVKLTDKPLSWEQAVTTAFQLAEKEGNLLHYAVRQIEGVWAVCLVMPEPDIVS